MRNQGLQGRMTAGRFALSAVIFTCIACWVMVSFLPPGLEAKEPAYSLWDITNTPVWTDRIVSFLSFAAVGYFLIELNNTFAIIHMRASVQMSLYFLLITACPGMYLLYVSDTVIVAFLISLCFPFKGYQDPRPARYLFHLFAFLSMGNVVSLQLTYSIPIWLLGVSNFQALASRSFCRAMTGRSVFYWFLLGHTLFYNEMALFYQPFANLTSSQPIGFGHSFRLWEVVVLDYLLILYMVSPIHYIMTGYEGRIQTHVYLHFLIFLSFCIFLFIVLQPTLGMSLFLLLLIGVSILAEYLFVLANSRTSNLSFIGLMVALIVLFYFNIWMLL